MAEGIGLSFLGKALGGIGEYLVAPIGRQFGYLFCFNTNLQNLETQLDSLKVTREGVQLGVDETRNNVRTVGPHLEVWLTKANDNTGEAETIIKDKAQVQKGCFNGWCPNLKLRYSLSRKAVKKTQELALLHAEGSNYTQSSYNPPPPSIQPIPTTTEFHGFDSRILVMNEIIEALEDDGIHLIGICGMGGMGKTTMAKEVAKRTKNLFNEFPMEVVSQGPDLTKVQGCIADMLGLKLDDKESPIARASLLRKRLLLDDKKILVILDDVWAEFDLEDLGFPLEGGRNKSCKILFTSRNQNIWKGIQNKRYIQLQVLVGDEPWHLFREKVGDCADNLDLLPLAKDIVNECGGLPLALVSMGSTLMNEHNQYHWNDALRQLRTPCSESLLSGVPAEVYQALYFSYNFLKDERAKKLFLLCCLFPEDCNIPIEDLVRYGIGLRWFEGIDKVDEVRDRVNVLLDQLKSCYLLLDDVYECVIKMHDVVRDVAISIAAKDKHGFMTIHGAKSREWPKKAAYELNTSILVISNEIAEFPGGLRCSKLEFLRIECRNSSLKIPSNFFEGMGELKVLDLRITKDISLLPSSLQFLSNLLTLHLDYCQNFDNIFVIGKLLNLEILSFRNSDIEELPKEIGGLVNLKLLDLTDCYELKRIAPGVISSLVQLQELYMGGYCTNIWEPEGKEGGENASLREFASLSNLNTLEINIYDVECLPRIPLFSKLTKYTIYIGDFDSRDCFGAEHITSFGNYLILDSRDCFDSPCTIPLECVNSLLRSSAVLKLIGMGSEDAVQELFREGVEGLQHLKYLVIGDCATLECFVNAMEWVPRTPNAISPIFPILERLVLFALPNLRKICHCQLPIGSFGKLKNLEIHNCDKIEEVIWNEKVEDDATNKMEFPALESMTLKSLPMLIGFCRGTDEIEFPQLKELSLQKLPQLKWLFLNSSNPFSESMENHNATFLSFFPHKVALPRLEEVELKDLDNLEGLEHIPISVGSFSKLRKLHVEHCGKWLYVFPSQFLTMLRNLEDLTVENFSLLEKVFELEMVDCKEQESEMLSLLKSLKLKHLPQLDYISKRDPIGFTYISQLSILHVHDCDNLRYLFPHSMMKCMLQLQELDIRRCKMMSMIVADEKGQDKSSVDKIEFTQLKILRLYHLPNLVSFFHQVIATSATSTERLQNVMQTLFNEKVAFPSLEKLELHGFQNMNEIWCNQLQTSLFNKLFSLDVSDCGSLRNTFSPFMARHLVHLKRLVIINCSMMEEVVAKEEEEKGRTNRTPLPKLEYLKLKDLPELKSFCHVTHNWELPLVDHVTVLNCPKMKTFSHGVICTPKLQHVFVKEGMGKCYPGTEGEDWLWINDLNQTIPHLIDEIIMGRKRKPDHPRRMMSDVLHNRTLVAPPSEEASHRPPSEGPLVPPPSDQPSQRPLLLAPPLEEAFQRPPSEGPLVPPHRPPLVAPQQLPCTQPPCLPSVRPPSVAPQQLSSRLESSAYEPSTDPSTSSQPTSGHVSSSSTSTGHGRGCAKGIREWGIGTKLDIQFDENYYPIGDNVSKLTTQLGIIVRNGNIVPLTFLDWNNVPDDIVDTIWKDVKDNLNICPEEYKPICMKNCNNIWKDYKNKIKAKHFKSRSSDPNLKDDVPLHIVPSQWEELVEYWRTSDAEMTNMGESTDKMNVWLMTHRADDLEVIQTLDEFNRQLTMLPEDCRTLEARNAIFHELIGHDAHGYCRTYGRTVPQRAVYKDGAGPSQSTPQPSTIVQITQQVCAELKDELRDELRAEFSTHLQQMRVEMMAFVSQGASVDPNRQVPDASSGHRAFKESAEDENPYTSPPEDQRFRDLVIQRFKAIVELHSHHNLHQREIQRSHDSEIQSNCEASSPPQSGPAISISLSQVQAALLMI